MALGQHGGGKTWTGMLWLMACYSVQNNMNHHASGGVWMMLGQLSTQADDSSSVVQARDVLASLFWTLGKDNPGPR